MNASPSSPTRTARFRRLAAVTLLVLTMLAQPPQAVRAQSLDVTPDYFAGLTPLDIAIGPDGTIFAIDAQNVHQRVGTAWQGIGQSGKRIDVGPGEWPYIVTASGALFYRPWGEWQPVSGGFVASDVGIGSGNHLFALGTVNVEAEGGFDVWYHKGDGAWEPVPGRRGVRIDVAPDGTPWIVDAQSNIWRRAGDAWQQVAGKAKDVSVGADGTVWIVSEGGALARLSGSEWQVTNSHVMATVAAQNAQTVVGLAGEGQPGKVTTSVQSAVPATGYRFVAILCKYGDVAAEPQNAAWVQGMFRGNPRSLEQYWAEVSYGQVRFGETQVAGWVPVGPKASYQGDSGKLVQECAKAADATVSFPAFSHVVIFMNDDLPVEALGVSSGGLTTTISLDGVTKQYGTSLLNSGALSPSSGVVLVKHEIGHTFRMQHSDAQGWDIEASPWCRDEHVDAYACWRPGPNAYNRDLAGWISPQRKLTYAGGPQQVTLKHLGDPGADGFVMAQIPIGTTGRFYTVEARKRTGWDAIVPDRAVIIHEVSTDRDDRSVMMSNGPQTEGKVGEGAMWKPGETFTDAANKLSIRIDSLDDTQAVVTISQLP